jgi:hypothetical protein
MCLLLNITTKVLRNKFCMRYRFIWILMKATSSYLSEVCEALSSGVAVGCGCRGGVCPTEKREIRTNIALQQNSTVTSNSQ